MDFETEEAEAVKGLASVSSLDSRGLASASVSA